MHHFFLDEQVIADEDAPAFALRLSADDAAHAKVVRLKPGEHISVVDAARDYFECEVVSAQGGDVEVRIAQRLEAPDEGPSVVLVQGIAKGDKMDDVIRHATEVGVAGFIPLASSRCVVKLDDKRAAAKVERWQRIAHSAAMQAGRLFEPEVSDVMDVSAAADAVAQATAVLVCWEECPTTSSIAEALDAAFVRCGVTNACDARIAVVVGPEGGLAPEEVEAFERRCARAFPVSLGPSILRTETAGVVAPALVLYECGAMGGRRRELA